MYNISYEFKKESVTLRYNKQQICFHSFYSIQKKPFRDFSRILQEKQPQDINRVFGMARRRNIKSQGGYTPSNIIF